MGWAFGIGAIVVSIEGDCEWFGDIASDCVYESRGGGEMLSGPGP